MSYANRQPRMRSLTLVVNFRRKGGLVINKRDVSEWGAAYRG